MRVNRGEHQQSDLDALSGTAIAGVMLPKVEEASEIEKAIEGFVRSLKVIVIIETAKALRTLDSIAKARRHLSADDWRSGSWCQPRHADRTPSLGQLAE